MVTDKKTDATAPAEDWGEDVAAFLPTWDFASDGDLVGTIIDQEEVMTEGISGEVRPVPKFTVVTDDGEKYNVWGSAVLSRVLPRHMNHRVKIADTGTQDMGAGQRLRYFDVRCATHKSTERAGDQA